MNSTLNHHTPANNNFLYLNIFPSSRTNGNGYAGGGGATSISYLAVSASSVLILEHNMLASGASFYDFFSSSSTNI
jgi:hypothetical protein